MGRSGGRVVGDDGDGGNLPVRSRGVRLLLDTHILLWGFIDPGRLTRGESDALRSPDNLLHVSVASLWEIAIKARRGRLSVPADLPDLVRASPEFRLLAITAQHVWRVRDLPAGHGDPFDQLLVAQAQVEDLVLMTRDRAMGGYDVSIFGDETRPSRS
ncbi:MAG: type II toxin-antitoxin system VapC family toxin [Caulobacteraceae bacterium]|nr:type II toxin-antitoxin system VapC family toxin [Caulobacteraceae bacterium]